MRICPERATEFARTILSRHALQLSLFSERAPPPNQPRAEALGWHLFVPSGRSFWLSVDGFRLNERAPTGAQDSQPRVLALGEMCE